MMDFLEWVKTTYNEDMSAMVHGTGAGFDPNVDLGMAQTPKPGDRAVVTDIRGTQSPGVIAMVQGSEAQFVPQHIIARFGGDYQTAGRRGYASNIGEHGGMKWDAQQKVWIARTTDSFDTEASRTSQRPV